MTEEMLAMTPYMMQIALNQTLQKIFKGKTYCGPGGEKELNFFEQDLPIDTGRDDAVIPQQHLRPTSSQKLVIWIRRKATRRWKLM